MREYVAVLGLELILDEAEGYAYLRQRAAAEGEPELARLVIPFISAISTGDRLAVLACGVMPRAR